MNEKRIHRAVSTDGTEIAGRVYGQGPPIVLVHSPVHNGDMAWEALLPLIADRFTCYLPNLRGRGISGDRLDQPRRRVHFQEDVNAFIDSIDEPVFLMSWSDGCSLTYGAAAYCKAVMAAVTYEPFDWALLPEGDIARFGPMIQQLGEAIAEDRLVEASHIFHRFYSNEEEFASLDPDYIERQARILPLIMQEPDKAQIDPDLLAMIDAPVLILWGQKTELDVWFTQSAQHIAKHLPKAQLRELAGIGHFAPLVAPEPIASETIEFFKRHVTAGSETAARYQSS